MYDVDDSGCINLQEMTNIIATMDELEGDEKVSHEKNFPLIIFDTEDESCGWIISAADVNILVLLIQWPDLSLLWLHNWHIFWAESLHSLNTSQQQGTPVSYQHKYIA